MISECWYESAGGFFMQTTGRLGLLDMDVLALSVRDRESRRLIDEAITAYRGGALRSALMSTWIAVAYDLISKVRELAALSDPAATAFVVEIDHAINAKDTKKFQNIENDLLNKVGNDLQLLAPHEYTAFTRLHDDRHLCAHPAFIAEDELYQPTPELVRAHIAHALQYLLVHAPLQGKSAIERFFVDLMNPSFPLTGDEIGVFVRARYLDRAKEVLVVNLIKAVVSAPFGSERAQYVSRTRTLAITLREILKAKTAIYDHVMPAYIAEKIERAQSESLLSICPFLDNDSRIWNWLKISDQMRIKRLLESADVQSLKSNAAFDAIVIPELSAIILNRLKDFDLPTTISIISEHPRAELVKPAIDTFRAARNYRDAESRGYSIIKPISKFFAPTDIENLLDAVTGNDQIWAAGQIPGILEYVFDITRELLPQTQQYWQAFVHCQAERYPGNVETYFAYPGLRRRLAEAR
jgi:hypothetical protein